MELDGFQEKRLTQNQVPELSPVWSPDGNSIAFASWEESPNYNLGYLFFSYGLGGESGAHSFSFGMCEPVPWPECSHLLGFEGTVAFNGGEPWKEDPSYDWGHEGGLTIAVGRRIVPHLFAVGVAGYSHQRVYDSDAGETLDSRHHFVWSGQLRYVSKRFLISAGYENRRGLVAGIGLGW